MRMGQTETFSRVLEFSEWNPLNHLDLPDLTIQQILKWADLHHQKTGHWPRRNSGDVQGAPGEKWGNIQAALYSGGRCLPGGSSLAKLLAKTRGVRNLSALPDQTSK